MDTEIFSCIYNVYCTMYVLHCCNIQCTCAVHVHVHACICTMYHALIVLMHPHSHTIQSCYGFVYSTCSKHIHVQSLLKNIILYTQETDVFIFNSCSYEELNNIHCKYNYICASLRRGKLYHTCTCMHKQLTINSPPSCHNSSFVGGRYS